MGDEKKGSKLDKLIMGIILGGAVGSVLGLTLAPRKGKETREIIKQKGHDILEKGKEVAGAAADKFIRDHRETIEGAKYQLKKGGKGFFRWLFKKKSSEPMPHASLEYPDEDRK